ncbi:MAG: type II toxin-antitoxin system RelE/ParE family toxin [bacterium]
MAKRKIEWSPNALEDLSIILNYYIERNGNKNYSRKLLTQIKKIISFIRDNNYLGKTTDDSKTRVLIYKNYKIFYEITEEKIKIKIIWDSRRNPEDLDI